MKDMEAFLVGAIGVGAIILIATKKPKPELEVRFLDFETKLVQSPEMHDTTYRLRDNVSAYDFWHFPVIKIVPDVVGEFIVEWNWSNKLDGLQGGYSAPTINNSFTITDIKGVNEFILIDNRDPISSGRDPNRGGSIAYGDPENIFDGLWHRFQSSVIITIKSPSGATVTITGELDETFKTIGVLSASFAGWSIQQK